MSALFSRLLFLSGVPLRMFAGILIWQVLASLRLYWSLDWLLMSPPVTSHASPVTRDW